MRVGNDRIPGNGAVFSFRALVALSVFVTWILISFGALVRLKGAGLACPDWPFCFGKVIPPPGLEIALEMGHRYLAKLLGLFIIGLVVLSRVAKFDASTRRLSILTLVMVCLQGLFGAFTVTLALHPLVVTGHLLGGNLVFACLIWLWVKSQKAGASSFASEAKAPGRPSVGTLVALNATVFLILASGGLNSTHYAGYVCDAFPLCQASDPFTFSWNQQLGFTFDVHDQALILNDTAMPTNSLEWIHLGHRFVAIFGGLAIVFLVLTRFGGMKGKQWGIIRYGLTGLIFLEFVVGVLNALWKIPVPVSTLHTAIAATITGLIVWATALAVEKV